MAKSTVCGPEMKRHTGRALSLQWPSSRALQPDTMRALPQGGNRRRLAHGARRLVAGKSATSATRARRETQWSAPRGKHLFFSLQVCRLPPPAPLARRWAPAPSPRGCTPPSAPPRPVSRAEAPPGTPYRPPKQLTAHTILLISVCRVGAKTGISTY